MNLQVSNSDYYAEEGTTINSNEEFLEHVLDPKNQTDSFYKLKGALNLLKKGAKGASKVGKKTGRGAKFKKAFGKAKGKLAGIGGGGSGGSSRSGSVDSGVDGGEEVDDTKSIIKGIDNKMLFIGGGVMMFMFFMVIVVVAMNKK